MTFFKPSNIIFLIINRKEKLKFKDLEKVKLLTVICLSFYKCIPCVDLLVQIAFDASFRRFLKFFLANAYATDLTVSR